MFGASGAIVHTVKIERDDRLASSDLALAQFAAGYRCGLCDGNGYAWTLCHLAFQPNEPPGKSSSRMVNGLLSVGLYAGVENTSNLGVTPSVRATRPTVRRPSLRRSDIARSVSILIVSTCVAKA